MSHDNMAPSQPEPGSDLLLSIEATEMRLNPDYVKFYLIYTNFIILSLIPFILLIIMNILIYRTVSLHSKEIEKNYLSRPVVNKVEPTG